MTRVLIVDDEPEFRDSLQDLLEDKGYQVDSASNGEEALELLRASELPCVVVLDLVMPVLDGIAVFGQMQQDPRLASVPVIVSTSDPTHAPSGVLIMKKPINLRRLLAAIEQHCNAER
jgi:CheY-like chemotaxis protein